MIISEQFSGDSLDIADIQHNNYSQALRTIVKSAIEAHRHSKEDCELGKLGDILNVFDHRPIQWFHDLIAAAFRFTYLAKFDFSIRTPSDLVSVASVTEQWLRFLSLELGQVFKRNSDLPRLILVAILYPNPDRRGMEAEDQIYEFARHLYPYLKCSKNE